MHFFSVTSKLHSKIARTCVHTHTHTRNTNSALSGLHGSPLYFTPLYKTLLTHSCSSSFLFPNSQPASRSAVFPNLLSQRAGAKKGAQESQPSSVQESQPQEGTHLHQPSTFSSIHQWDRELVHGPHSHLRLRCSVQSSAQNAGPLSASLPSASWLSLGPVPLANVWAPNLQKKHLSPLMPCSLCRALEGLLVL